MRSSAPRQGEDGREERATTGSEHSRLIIVRGNSGSGKTRLAQAIRAARPRGVAIVGHDVLRREILHVRDHPGALSVPYIDLSARFALDHGLDVVVEGILHSESYGEMLARLRDDHVGVTRCYYYDLPLDETLRRHRTKPLAAEVSEADVASWYRSEDRVPALDESVFDATVSAAAALERVLADAGWTTSHPRG
ncbi:MULTISPECIES: zeta toxin family protein [unclassified Isoptericola]|uniref:zeta toxin family protein n=1 Tax=unclassified Isoptericola TaxID=2623355 RepID=UPI003655B7B0